MKIEYCMLSVEYLISLMIWNLIKSTTNNIESNYLTLKMYT